MSTDNGVKSGAWSARTNNQDQFIQADLRQLHEVSGVMTQGRNMHLQWVNSFRVQYSIDGLTWTAVQNAIMAGSKVFTGNTDSNTIVTNDFSPNVVTRFIRIEPLTWTNHISMRFEIIGTVASKIEGLQKALGMKDQQIPNSAITASTQYDGNHGTEGSRLDTVASGVRGGAWSALTNDVNQWLQVDLNGFYILTGVITQGRQDTDQWVNAFKVAYGEDGTNWNIIQTCDGCDGYDKVVFNGNIDRNSKVTTAFGLPIVGRFLRIHPTTWNNHISMRLEILGKGPVASNRFEPMKLGMEDGQIADSQLSASTCHDSNHCADRARLNQVASGGKTDAWTAITLDSQWIQVDLLSDYKLSGIVIQGRSDYDQWVTSYRLQYRPDGESALIDVVDDNGAIVTFTGNSDGDSLVINMLPLPVAARYVRILPQTWNSYISMRFELLGIGPINVAPVFGKIGIEDGRVDTTSLSASSCWDSNYCVAHSRLNQPQEGALGGAWIASTSDVNQWIQVDLRVAFEVTGVITQGRNSSTFRQWVTSYQISYSIDGKDWTLVKNCEGGPKIFPGNSDRDSLVENGISPPVTARFIRLQPVTWYIHISMRWELIGQGPIRTTGLSAQLGLEDYRIPEGAITASSQYDSTTGPRRARLNLPASGALKGGWSALTLDRSQWLQVDLRGTYRVTGIITQGRADIDQWVTSYNVAHSLNGINFNIIQIAASQQEKYSSYLTFLRVFTGNSNRTTQVTNYFSPPLTTRFIRVLPIMWFGHISLRMELLGAGPVAAILNDHVPLGLESNIIPDSSLTASSEFNADYGAKRGRLNLAQVGNLRGAWSALAINANQWIQVDLLDPYRIISVATQGRQDLSQWVTSYKLACSTDGTTFATVQGICTNPGADRIFNGNVDRDTIVTNTLPVPQVCRYVRLMPVSWFGHISLRMELYGEGPLTV
ncbi:uncharacterized protein LOC115924199 [Strongylocentrotus purpuratus]|uniref:F5/8 type C domain-containing protein n=1 Tax=Strongylocentrotus purpuratus TaxID=7668 RepID=A0A7M7NUR9_STRPU|nr:uncharacterized protein LOC115924199 [Strongylocentrotus purpuratus]